MLMLVCLCLCSYCLARVGGCRAAWLAKCLTSTLWSTQPSVSPPEPSPTIFVTVIITIFFFFGVITIVVINVHKCVSTIFWFNHHPQFSHLISSHSITNAINTIGVQHKQSFSWNVPCWQNHLYQHHDLHQSVCLARAFW